MKKLLLASVLLVGLGGCAPHIEETNGTMEVSQAEKTNELTKYAENEKKQKAHDLKKLPGCRDEKFAITNGIIDYRLCNARGAVKYYDTKEDLIVIGKVISSGCTYQLNTFKKIYIAHLNCIGGDLKFSMAESEKEKSAEEFINKFKEDVELKVIESIIDQRAKK